MKNNLIAHRGLHDKTIPENSMKAFKKALEYNLPIELDVHILKDNSIAVFHDDNLKRMTGLDKNIIDSTYEEIRNLKLNKTDEIIPLLEDVLKLVDGKVLLDIELKYDHEKYRLEEALIEVLSKYNGEFILKSFDYKTVKFLKKKTNYKVGLLIKNLESKNVSKREKFFFKSSLFINYIKPDFIACDYRILDYKIIKKYKGKLPIYAWTIKNRELLEEIEGKADYYLVENII